MGQSNPGGTHYQDLLRNLYNAQAKGDRGEIDHWERTIEGLRQEAANRGIRI